MANNPNITLTILEVVFVIYNTFETYELAILIQH